MKILIIGDLHGKKPRLHFKNFDIIISTGDICSDKEIGKFTKQWFKYLKNNRNISLDRFIISKIGKKEMEAIEKRSLKEGRKIMEFLNSFKKPVFIVPGNWDQSYGETNIKDLDKNRYTYHKAFFDFYLGNKINQVLTKNLKNIKDCQFKIYKYNNYNILGYGLSSGPEDISIGHKFKRKNVSKIQYEKLKKAYKKILNKLENVYEKRDKRLPTIFISHNVPYNTKLDLITNKESYAYKKHLGSTVARYFCIKNQPLLCIGGHIHDNFKKDKIGKTTVINAGFGQDANIFIEVYSNNIKKIQFYS